GAMFSRFSHRTFSHLPHLAWPSRKRKLLPPLCQEVCWSICPLQLVMPGSFPKYQLRSRSFQMEHGRLENQQSVQGLMLSHMIIRLTGDWKAASLRPEMQEHCWPSPFS